MIMSKIKKMDTNEKRRWSSAIDRCMEQERYGDDYNCELCIQSLREAKRSGKFDHICKFCITTPYCKSEHPGMSHSCRLAIRRKFALVDGYPTFSVENSRRFLKILRGWLKNA